MTGASQFNKETLDSDAQNNEKEITANLSMNVDNKMKQKQVQIAMTEINKTVEDNNAQQTDPIDSTKLVPNIRPALRRQSKLYQTAIKLGLTLKATNFLRNSAKQLMSVEESKQEGINASSTAGYKLILRDRLGQSPRATEYLSRLISLKAKTAFEQAEFIFEYYQHITI